MPKTKTPRVSRTKPSVYPYSVRRALTGNMEDMIKDKRNQAARVAYGDKGVIALGTSFGATSSQLYGEKVLKARRSKKR